MKHFGKTLMLAAIVLFAAAISAQAATLHARSAGAMVLSPNTTTTGSDFTIVWTDVNGNLILDESEIYNGPHGSTLSKNTPQAQFSGTTMTITNSEYNDLRWIYLIDMPNIPGITQGFDSGGSHWDFATPGRNNEDMNGTEPTQLWTYSVSPEGGVQEVSLPAGDLGYGDCRKPGYPTGTLLDNGVVHLEWQGDGNLVLYKYGAADVWSSNTAGSGAYLCFGSAGPNPEDGDLRVLNAADTKILWSTHTGGRGASLVLQKDCNLVIKDSSGGLAWVSRTQMDTYTCSLANP